MHTLKSYTAKRLAQTGVIAPVWQNGYHDHGLRNDEDYRARVRYVMQNPVRAGLVNRIEEFPAVILPAWWGES
jgi:REP element-mobilizing transposase RayT